MSLHICLILVWWGTVPKHPGGDGKRGICSARGGGGSSGRNDTPARFASCSSSNKAEYTLGSTETEKRGWSHFTSSRDRGVRSKDDDLQQKLMKIMVHKASKNFSYQIKFFTQGKKGHFVMM